MSRIDLNKVKEAADILRRGGIVVYPTETVYGIGCDPLNEDACERVQRLKRRSGSKPFILIADSLENVEEFAGMLDIIPRKLAGMFWPGPLTMVIRPLKSLPEHLRGPTGGIAFRVTPHPAAASLSREFGRPVVSTSANITDEHPVSTYDDAVEIFGDYADIILDNPEPLRGQPSTVIDLTSSSPHFLRIGTIAEEQIRRVL